MGNKASKLLAWLDKKEWANRWVADIQYMDGTQIQGQEPLEETFVTYYTSSVQISQ